MVGAGSSVSSRVGAGSSTGTAKRAVQRGQRTVRPARLAGTRSDDAPHEGQRAVRKPGSGMA